MPYQRVPETASVTLVFNVTGQVVTNIFYASYFGGYNQAGLDALASAVDNDCPPGYKSIMGVNDQYLRTDVRGLDSEFDLTSTANASAGACSLAQTSLPAHVTLALSKRSAFTGRSARGTTFFPSVLRLYQVQTNDQENQVSTTAGNAMLAVVDSVRNCIDNIGVWDPVLVSRYSNGSKRSEAITFPWVATQLVTYNLASRRDRRP